MAVIPAIAILFAGAEIPVLPELLILAVCAIFAVLILRKFRLPVITGLLAAGALAGPQGFHLVSHSEHLSAFADIGVALLLFTIGLEFNRERIAATGSRAAIAGVFQVLLTLAAAGGIAIALGMSLTQSLYIGMVVSLSSTAIVLRALMERAELSAPHGRLILGTLIVQDLAIVPMLILVPLIAGSSGNIWSGLGVVLLKAAVLLGLAWAVSRYALPYLMSTIAAIGSRDIFLLTALTIALGMSWLTSISGLSPALGAFIAGIMLANSQYAHHTLSEVLPVRELFFSFFFIAMGMLFDWRILVSYPLQVLGVLLLLLLGKGIIAAIAVVLLRFPLRTTILFGLGLAQFGEFGYLLLQAGKSPPLDMPLIDPASSSILLCAGLISMFLTPLSLILAPRLAAGTALLRPMERLLRARGIDEPERKDGCLSDHVIVAGLGPAGRLLLEQLLSLGIPFVVLELNSETVKELRAKGLPIYYGDITSREALEHACIRQASAVVITFQDRTAVSQAISVIKQIAPHVNVITRASFTNQVDPLMKLGANQVVVDELATGKALIEAILACRCSQQSSPAPEA